MSFYLSISAFFGTTLPYELSKKAVTAKRLPLRFCSYGLLAKHGRYLAYFNLKQPWLSSIRGPSIYDVHTDRGRVRLRWAHMDGGGGPAPCGRPLRKLKLESTDVILSSSHAKKLASFSPEFRLWTEKSGNFSAI